MNRHDAMQIMLQLKYKVRQWNKHWTNGLKWLNVDLVRFLLVSKMQIFLTKDRCRTTRYFKCQGQSYDMLFYDTIKTKQKDWFDLIYCVSAIHQLYHGEQF